MPRYAFPVIVAAAVAAVWMFALPPAPLAQPIAFNHAKHAAVGCVLCHQGVATAARAGIPQADTCTRCHATAPGGKISEAAWTDIAAGKRIAGCASRACPITSRSRTGGTPGPRSSRACRATAT
jgi:hypothetical protein